jgi:hypothetical protein
MRAAVKVPLVLAAVALPIALATPASAATESAGAATASASAAPSTAGCTLLTVYKPEAAGTDWLTGQKRVAYKVTIKCPAFVPVYVQVQQKWYEKDSGGSQAIGSRTSFQAMPLGGSHTFRVDDDLPDTEAGSEEMWQKARFFAVNHLPVPAGVSYGPWVSSGVSSLPN